MNNIEITIHERYQQYKAKIRKEKRTVRLIQLLLFVSFFGLWEIASRNEWIDPLIFSSPTKVWALFLEHLQTGQLFSNLSITLFETVLGFILGTVAGVLLAILLWWSPRISNVLDPYMVVMNAMPKVALGPILIVALGPNFSSIIAMGVLISVIITTLVVYSAFQEVDPNYPKVLQTFQASKKQVFQEAIFPASLPTIISTLKVNVGLSWVGVIVGEYLVSNSGLGYMIIYGFQVFNFTLVMLSLLLIALCATLMYQGVEWIERKALRRTRQ
ncbi:ABC transporter permease [Bacillus fonticola]|uniref:ABC transporter permease n=1 Tax=Bacillus fonticola TaxID=2728853 RepID=UPI001D14DC29|nr:ABC transporter permease [Bacillus fonticola]